VPAQGREDLGKLVLRNARSLDPQHPGPSSMD
jgi:hypothetical protein